VKSAIPPGPPSPSLPFAPAGHPPAPGESFLRGGLRKASFRAVNGAHFDVAILGAGISGARIFHELSRCGYRVLLMDRGDFASGTSQASGMMIWGGLLYLKDFDFHTVINLCRSRDQLIEQLPGKVRAESLRYLSGVKSLRSRHFVRAGMLLYWLLGSSSRRLPGREGTFSGLEMLKAGRFRESLTVEEAVLKGSDCRFALEWILPFNGSRTVALNHCAVEVASFDQGCGRWQLELRDRLHGQEATTTASFVVNAAGVWADKLNASLGVESPYRHELSKGVYISFRRPDCLRQIFVFDTGENEEILTFVPWGPVALCGPTESRVTDISEGFAVSPDDVRYLLRLANQNLHASYGVEDIVSMRCGIRPLAVRRGSSNLVHPLELSRKHRVHHHLSRQAVAVYGGKLTSCGALAKEVFACVAPYLSRPEQVSPPHAPAVPPTTHFPGLSEPVPSPAWCRDHEHCHTLDDYLRRRTNIAQWIPRCGLGASSENLRTLREIALIFSSDESEADVAIAGYQDTVRERHDDILAAV
jgi:glycerol-3-phosphate dehydrogenase